MEIEKAVLDETQNSIEEITESCDFTELEEKLQAQLKDLIGSAGIPFDPSHWLREQHDEALKDFDTTDKELVCGYFLAERMLNTLMPDATTLDVGFTDCDDINVDLFDYLFDKEDED